MRLDFKALARCRTPSVHCQETLVAFKVSFPFTMHSLVEGEKGANFLSRSQKHLVKQARQTLVLGPGCESVITMDSLPTSTSDSPVHIRR